MQVYRHRFQWLLIFAIIGALLIGCGDDDDDDSGAAPAGDDDDDNDDSDDDDDNDDDSTDDDDDDDDDSDDDDDDDSTDDDDDDDSFSCDALTDEELNLFRDVFCAGASYSYPNLGNPPYGFHQLYMLYHGKLMTKIWENLGQCVDYDPNFWIYWYDDVDLVTSEMTLSWAVDAYYHFLDGGPTPAEFRQRIADYLAVLYGEDGLAPGAWFITGNVPKLLMLLNGYPGDRDEALTIMEEETALYENTVLIDFNFFMEKLIAGKTRYDGERLGFFDIIQLDFLHATRLGHQVIADIYIDELNAIWPNLKIENWGEIEIIE